MSGNALAMSAGTEGIDRATTLIKVDRSSNARQYCANVGSYIVNEGRSQRVTSKQLVETARTEVERVDILDKLTT